MLDDERTILDGSDLVKINIGKLYEHPSQPRIDYNPTVIESVRSEIRANVVDGRKQFPKHLAITVRDGGVNYTIISGHTRVKAAKEEGIISVWAHVMRYKDDTEAAFAVMLANNQQGFTPAEIGRHAKWMRENKGVSLHDYAKRCGRSYASIRNAVVVYEFCERNRSLFSNLDDLAPASIVTIERVNLDQETKTDKARFEIIRRVLELTTPLSMVQQIVDLVNKGAEVAQAFEMVYAAPKGSLGYEAPPAIVQQVADDAFRRGREQALKNMPSTDVVSKIKTEMTSGRQAMAEATSAISRLREENEAFRQENLDLRQQLADLRQKYEDLRQLSGYDD